jgi:hypothetical protein
VVVRAVVIFAAIGILCWVPVAHADDIEPGLWKTTTRVDTGNGVIGPPRESQKCLTPDETRDLAKTFSPVSRTVNSECAPLESNLVGGILKWKLVCKGQLDMELTGEFNFDKPRHYTATVTSKAAMAGMPITNSKTMLEAEWVSECP